MNNISAKVTVPFILGFSNSVVMVSQGKSTIVKYAIRSINILRRLKMYFVEGEIF